MEVSKDMFSHNGRISARQTMVILILQMVNMGILILPRVCVSYVGRNGYILPLLAIPIGLIYLLCITGLTKQFPNATLYELSEQILNSLLAKILVYVLVVKMIMSIGLELRLFGELISQVMLVETPLEVIILVILLAVSYLAKSGVEAVVRMGEVLAYFIFIPMLFILVVMSTKMEYREVMPFFQVGKEEIGIGTGVVSLWFMPIEILLIIGGLMKRPEKAFKAGAVAIIVSALVEALFVLFAICKLGPTAVIGDIWPTLTLMRSMSMRSGVLEKQEIVMVILWIFTTYLYASMMLCTSSVLISRSFKFKRENIFVLPLMVVIFFVAIWPESLSKMYNAYLKFRFYFSIWFLLPIPLILWLVAKLRGLGNENKVH